MSFEASVGSVGIRVTDSVGGDIVVITGTGVDVGAGLGVTGVSVAVGVSVTTGTSFTGGVAVGMSADSLLQATKNNAMVIHGIKYLISFFIACSFRCSLQINPISKVGVAFFATPKNFVSEWYFPFWK